LPAALPTSQTPCPGSDPPCRLRQRALRSSSRTSASRSDQYRYSSSFSAHSIRFAMYRTRSEVTVHPPIDDGGLARLRVVRALVHLIPLSFLTLDVMPYVKPEVPVELNNMGHRFFLRDARATLLAARRRAFAILVLVAW